MVAATRAFKMSTPTGAFRKSVCDRGRALGQVEGARVERAGDFFLLDHDDHPDADFLVRAQHGRAVYPSRLSLEAGTLLPRVRCRVQPGHFGRDADALGQRFEDTISNVLWAADAVQQA